MEQAQRFHQQAAKEPQKTDCRKQEKKALMQQRLTDKGWFKVDVDSGPNLDYAPLPFGGTAALVPPYPA